ncbi:MAG TPA: 6,7-dimethyl-8-ribityllumazine synthase [Polyangia bacterium]|nr:6,7-dimethyl-8-ribityllumazine synthase [Polyangia bacterium]
MPKTHEGPLRADGKRFAVVASRFNEFIVDKLLTGALDALRRSGAEDGDVEVFRCPGAFEIPGLARRVADSGRFDALVCLGAVIRGATPHFDLVVNQSTAGIAAIAAEAKVAVGLGVLACDTIEQAVERAGSKAGNRGYDAAMVAVEMCSLYASLSSRSARAMPAKGGGARRTTR